MRLIFIGPASNLSTGNELIRILSASSNTTVEVVDGMVDRAGLDRALRGAQYDAIHFAGHGTKGVLDLSDGLLDSSDLTSMVQEQRSLKFIIINACNSLSVATALHNAMHVPIIAHDSEIQDPAAVRFSETFYRAYRQGLPVGEAFARAYGTVMRLFPSQVNIPQLINGDMATHTEINDCMDYIRTELTTSFTQINERLDSLEVIVNEMHRPRSAQITMVLLGVLVVAQLVTPWLNALFTR